LVDVTVLRSLAALVSLPLCVVPVTAVRLGKEVLSVRQEVLRHLFVASFELLHNDTVLNPASHLLVVPRKR
jgi:hypothetical protein